MDCNCGLLSMHPGLLEGMVACPLGCLGLQLLGECSYVFLGERYEGVHMVVANTVYLV